MQEKLKYENRRYQLTLMKKMLHLCQHEWTNENNNLKFEFNHRYSRENHNPCRMELLILIANFPAPKFLCASRGRHISWRIH